MFWLMRALVKLKTILFILLVMVGSYYLFLKKPNSFVVNEDDSKTRIEKKIKREPASIELKKIKEKKQTAVNKLPASSKKIKNNATSLFDSNYRNEVTSENSSHDAQVINENEKKSYENQIKKQVRKSNSIINTNKFVEHDRVEEQNEIINIDSSFSLNNNPKVADDILDPASPSDEEFLARPQAINCKADKTTGVFTGGFSLKVTCNRPGAIYYCVSTTGYCDPFNTKYTGPISIGPANNDYFVSYYGISEDGQVSVVSDHIFTINSELPSLSTFFPKQYVQTTEAPIVTKTQSLDFGKENHYFSQYNFFGHNPTSTGMNWSCDDIITNYAGLTAPSVLQIDENFATNGLNPSSEIEQIINTSGLSYGENFIATVLEDRSRYLTSCETQRVVLRDFKLFSFLGVDETPIVSGVRRTQGGFVGYSYFETIPSATQGAGQSESERAPASLEENFITITN